MRYLLDTVAVSELRKKHVDANFRQWMMANKTATFYISSVSIGEIQIGIEKVRSKDPAFADELEHWLNALEVNYSDNLITFAAAEAKTWGRLVVSLGRKDTDLQIAAIAEENNLVVVTRNVDDFLPTGVKVVNPWTFQPEVI